MKAIVYQSNTGHTLAYAKLLSEEVKLPYYTIKEAKEKISEQDEIIFLGWICASKIQGLKKVKKYQLKCIGAVGSYPNEKEYIESLKKANGVTDNLFYLRGGIDLQKLTGIKKKLLQWVGKMMKKDNSIKNQEMIQLFTQGVNYVEKENLEEMITFLKFNQRLTNTN
jgi:hypothetical protein